MLQSKGEDKTYVECHAIAFENSNPHKSIVSKHFEEAWYVLGKFYLLLQALNNTMLTWACPDNYTINTYSTNNVIIKKLPSLLSAVSGILSISSINDALFSGGILQFVLRAHKFGLVVRVF